MVVCSPVRATLAPVGNLAGSERVDNSGPEVDIRSQVKCPPLDSCSKRNNRPPSFSCKRTERLKKSPDLIEVRFRTLGELDADSRARNSVGKPSIGPCLALSEPDSYFQSLPQI